MNSLELREKRKMAVEAAEKLVSTANAEKRELTEDEKQKVDELGAESENWKKKYEEAKADERRLDDLVKARGELDATAHEPPKSEARQPTLTPENRQQRDIIPAECYASRNPTTRRFRGKEGRQEAYKCGIWIANLIGNEWAKKRADALGLECRAMSGTTLSGGGALVPAPLSQAIIDNREMFGVARQVLRVRPMSSDTQDIPIRTGAVTAYAVSENTEITASDESWGNVALTARKWGALTKVSSELAEDAIIDVADDVASDIGRAFAEKEDDAWINGDGTSTYHGIVGMRTLFVDGTSWTGLREAAATIDKLEEMTLAEINYFMALLPEYALPNAAFLVSPAMWQVMQGLATAAGGTNTADIIAGVINKRFLGYPVVTSTKMPNLIGTSYDGVIFMLFGDFNRACVFGERRGFRARVLQERYAEYDQLGVVATTRFDINVADIGTTSVAGPIVGVKGNIS